MKSGITQRGHETRGSVWCFCCLGAYTLLAPNYAHAYLDPASGSLILQIVAGAILGAALTAKMWWLKFRVLLSKVWTTSRSNTENLQDDDN